MKLHNFASPSKVSCMSKDIRMWLLLDWESMLKRLKLSEIS